MSRRALTRARLAAGLVGYLRQPLDRTQAGAELRARLRLREQTFLRLARDAIFSAPDSPYLPLLRWAGWDYARLERAVLDSGLEQALCDLRDAGVWVSRDELKGARIVRPGLEIAPSAEAFRGPAARKASLEATSSGTSGQPTSPVGYGWQLFRDEAPLELLLLESHGVLDAPTALWLPAQPGIAGLHNVLVQMRFRRPPERWFSQLRPQRRHAPAVAWLRGVGRAFGMRVAAPEPAGSESALRVARWMEEARQRAGAAVLKAYASAAIRVAEVALARNLDLSGCLFLAGGEPLSPRGREYIERTGASVFARYVATETGWIAGECPQAEPGAMHLYSDRVAAIPGERRGEGERARPPDGRGDRRDTLLFTSLTEASPTLLLNADIGDRGRLGVLACPCPFGRAGLLTELRAVHPQSKLAGGGTTVAVATMRDLLEELLIEQGLRPDRFRLAEEEDELGIGRVVVELDEEIGERTAEHLRLRLLERLPSRGVEGEVAAKLWGEGDVLRVRPAVQGRSGKSLGSEGSAGATDGAGIVGLDPMEWARVHDSSGAGDEGAVFRRGVEVASAACLARSDQGARWADVGCGTGHLAAELAAAGLEVVGCDLDPRMVAYARGRFGSGADRVRFERAAAEDLPFEDRSLDGVVATSLAGILPRLGPFFEEAHRILRPGGWLVLTFTNSASAVHAIRAAGLRLSAATRGARLGLGEGGGRPTREPVRLYTPRAATAAVTEAGFGVEGIRYYNFPLEGRRRSRSHRRAIAAGGAGRDRPARFLARNFLLIAQRRQPASAAAV